MGRFTAGLYVNAETALNSSYFDSTVRLLDYYLHKPEIAASMGTVAVARCISLLDCLEPAQVRNGVAKLTKKQIAAGKIAVLFSQVDEKIQIDRRVHGHHAKAPKKAQARMSQETRDAILFSAGGFITWNDVQVDGYEDRSTPVVVLDRNTNDYHRSSIFVHELTHVHQCLDTPLHTRAYFQSKDCITREELEAYDWEARYDTGLMHTGAVMPVATTAIQINNKRISLAPPANDPYRPTERLERQLMRDFGISFEPFSS